MGNKTKPHENGQINVIFTSVTNITTTIIIIIIIVNHHNPKY
jgi:hypothetical protein